jgi:hypothetical protein
MAGNPVLQTISAVENERVLILHWRLKESKKLLKNQILNIMPGWNHAVFVQPLSQDFFRSLHIDRNKVSITSDGYCFRVDSFKLSKVSGIIYYTPA